MMLIQTATAARADWPPPYKATMHSHATKADVTPVATVDLHALGSVGFESTNVLIDSHYPWSTQRANRMREAFAKPLGSFCSGPLSKGALEWVEGHQPVDWQV